MVDEFNWQVAGWWEFKLISCFGGCQELPRTMLSDGQKPRPPSPHTPSSKWPSITISRTRFGVRKVVSCLWKLKFFMSNGPQSRSDRTPFTEKAEAATSGSLAHVPVPAGLYFHALALSQTQYSPRVKAAAPEQHS